jgi:hypothetical protein
MIDSRIAILTQIKAATEVLWTPFRFTRDNGLAAAAVFERRDAYETGGVEVRGGGSGAVRQARVVDLQAIVAAGLIATHGTSNALLLKLTELGDAAITALSGNYRIADEAWPLLVLAKVLARNSFLPILEDDFLRRHRSPRTLGALASLATPLLSRGFLPSNSDQTQHVGYLITPDGVEALSAGPPAQADLSFDRSVADYFDELYGHGIADRESWIPQKRNSHVIPLSCGCWQTTKDSEKAKRFRRSILDLWGPENEPAAEVSDERPAGPPAASITWQDLLQQLGLDRPTLAAWPATAGDSAAPPAAPGASDDHLAGPTAAEIVPPVSAEGPGDG